MMSFIFSQLHSLPLTATTSTPANVASATEPKKISYQDETKTLEAVEQPRVLQVEAGVPSVSATASIMEGQNVNTSSVAVPSEEGTGRTKHSTRTKGKHKTATHKRQHGELRLVCAKLCSIISFCHHTLYSVFSFVWWVTRLELVPGISMEEQLTNIAKGLQTLSH